jgi:hypothetical protein
MSDDESRFGGALNPMTDPLREGATGHSGDTAHGSWTIHIGLTDGAPEDEAQAFMDAVAEFVIGYEPRTGWDGIVTAGRDDLPPRSVEASR